jgi:hypothetical protein
MFARLVLGQNPWRVQQEILTSAAKDRLTEEETRAQLAGFRCRHTASNNSDNIYIP